MLGEFDWFLVKVFVIIVLVQGPPDGGAPGGADLLPDNVGDEQALTLLQTGGRLEGNPGQAVGLSSSAHGNLLEIR